MNHLAVLLLLAPLVAASDNSSTTNICIEYAECMSRAQTKAAECASELNETGKKGGCDNVKALQAELKILYQQRSQDLDTCVRSKASTAEVLTGRKANKCENIAKKLSKRSPLDARKKKEKKEKPGKEGKAKACAKEARKLRGSCAKMAKCCSVIKDCHAAQDKNALVAKKEEMKDAVKECRVDKIKNRKTKQPKATTLPTDVKSSKASKKSENKQDKQEKKGLSKMLQDAQKKKRSAPIGGKLADDLAV